MNVVIIGAGNIGRGFIGPLFSQCGANINFVDVAKPVVEQMMRDHQYPVCIVSNSGNREIIVRNVSATDGTDAEAEEKVLMDADVCVTCVGAGAIKYIIPNLARGIKARYTAGKAPLNLLICENLMDADKYIHSLLEPLLTPDELDQIGLVETSVGRMVPVPKPEDRAENPLRICVEEYCVLPIDRNAIKGKFPEIPNIVPFAPFHYYIERKLYIHNMGHAVCAYLGDYLGYEYIWQSIADSNVRLIVTNAMIQSAVALASAYKVPVAPLIDHVNDLIRRFGNIALGDTCARVGNDIPRKLAKSDRLTGASLSVINEGSHPVYISIGTAAALYKYVKDNAVAEVDVKNTLVSLTSLDEDSEIVRYTLELYRKFAEGTNLSDILASADEMLKNENGMIV